jgi:hypothetical protein
MLARYRIEIQLSLILAALLVASCWVTLAVS